MSLRATFNLGALPGQVAARSADLRRREVPHRLHGHIIRAAGSPRLVRHVVDHKMLPEITQQIKRFGANDHKDGLCNTQNFQ